ncbi:MAG: hypothetical protein PHW74_09185 [Desulfobacca sp.]|nr:hypothetical protein [Desulfobacca sp.]
MPADFRQEVLNVILAQILQERGVVSVPESIISDVLVHRRRMPDVMIDFYGLRTVIEGEVGDRPAARERALNSARQRVEEGIAHIGIAVVYPSYLRQVEFDQLKPQLNDSQLEVAIFTESGERGFTSGSIDYLTTLLHQTLDQLIKQDVVAEAVAILDTGIDRVNAVVRETPGFISRAAQILGIRLTGKITPSQVNGISRISSLVVVNAMIFQEILAEHEGAVYPLQKMLERDNLLAASSDHWRFILDEIDYYPIFYLAREIILSLTAQADTLAALENLVHTAQKIVSLRAALRHDLMGRVYHRLLAEAKYLGTYYTSVPAAVLLLKLALGDNVLMTSWHDLAGIAQLRIADLACGTGTLLMAAAEAISDNYLRSCARNRIRPFMGELHRFLAEEVIYGYDVLPSAVHLTASTLALRAPDIAFAKMNLFSLPLGGPEFRLGSLEFLKSRDLKTRDLFGALVETRTISSWGESENQAAQIPDLDLCVMNPPFTRSVGGNLLFGSVPEAERRQMQSDLRELVGRSDLKASITAGLGAVFAALGDRYLKPGGRLALVLPKALISGVAWEQTRELLRSRYRLEYLVCSHDPLRWNFSESTDLSEILLVAAKINEASAADSDNLTVVNLWRNPTSAIDAVTIFHALKDNPSPPQLPQGQGALELLMGQEKLGEAITISWEEAKKWSQWMLPCAFAQSDLIRAAYHLLQGKLWLPGYGQVGIISLSMLSNFGTLGPDRRDIHDGFNLSKSLTAYPSFWGHDAQSVFTMEQSPNAYLSPLAHAKNNRPLRQVEDLWPLAGKVLLAERLRLNTQRLTVTRCSEPVLSNMWWPVKFIEHINMDRFEKILVLWLNSTLGLIILLANRQETEGAWIDFKKPIFSNLPVLDLNTLSEDQLKRLAATYDALGHQGLQPFPEMHVDPVRAQIDATIAEVLSLPDFPILRRLLAQEPVVCLRRL